MVGIGKYGEKKFMNKLALYVIFAFMVVGCTNYSGNMRIGTASYGYSIAEQRDAMSRIQVSNELPSGAYAIGNIDASRCHMDTMAAEPTEELIMNDLIMFAYARGADGIYNVNIRTNSAILNNCWYILTGTASLYKYQTQGSY